MDAVSTTKYNVLGSDRKDSSIREDDVDVAKLRDQVMGMKFDKSRPEESSKPHPSFSSPITPPSTPVESCGDDYPGVIATGSSLPGADSIPQGLSPHLVRMETADMEGMSLRPSNAALALGRRTEGEQQGDQDPPKESLEARPSMIEDLKVLQDVHRGVLDDLSPVAEVEDVGVAGRAMMMAVEQEIAGDGITGVGVPSATFAESGSRQVVTLQMSAQEVPGSNMALLVGATGVDILPTQAVLADMAETGEQLHPGAEVIPSSFLGTEAEGTPLTGSTEAEGTPLTGSTEAEATPLTGSTEAEGTPLTGSTEVFSPQQLGGLQPREILDAEPQEEGDAQAPVEDVQGPPAAHQSDGGLKNIAVAGEEPRDDRAVGADMDLGQQELMERPDEDTLRLHHSAAHQASLAAGMMHAGESMARAVNVAAVAQNPGEVVDFDSTVEGEGRGLAQDQQVHETCMDPSPVNDEVKPAPGLLGSVTQTVQRVTATISNTLSQVMNTNVQEEEDKGNAPQSSTTPEKVDHMIQQVIRGQDKEELQLAHHRASEAAAVAGALAHVGQPVDKAVELAEKALNASDIVDAHASVTYVKDGDKTVRISTPVTAAASEIMAVTRGAREREA